MGNVIEVLNYEEEISENAIKNIKSILCHNDFEDLTNKEKYNLVVEEISKNIGLENISYESVDYNLYKNKYSDCAFKVGEFYFIKYKDDKGLSRGHFKLERVLKKTSCGQLIMYDIFLGVENGAVININKRVTFEQILQAYLIIFDKDDREKMSNVLIRE